MYFAAFSSGYTNVEKKKLTALQCWEYICVYFEECAVPVSWFLERSSRSNSLSMPSSGGMGPEDEERVRTQKHRVGKEDGQHTRIF